MNKKVTKDVEAIEDIAARFFNDVCAHFHDWQRCSAVQIEY